MSVATQDQTANLRGPFPDAVPSSRAIAPSAEARSLDRIVAEARAGATSRIGVTVHHVMADAEISWRAFEAEAVGLGFQSFDWLNAWHIQVGSAEHVEPAIVMVSLDGVPVMHCAFGIERRLGMRCLTWLGGKFADYKAPMLAPDFAERVTPDQFAAIWERIQREVPTHDFIALENQPSHVGALVNPFASLAGEPAPDEAYLIDLPATYKEFTQRFRAATRRADRSKERKLDEAGKLEFRIAEDAEEARRMAADILDRKVAQLRAQGIASIFEDAGYRAAYIALSALPPKRRLLQVAKLTLNGEFLSGSIAHIRGDHVTLMVHTYENAFSRLSPGRLHLLKLVQTSIDAGHKTYDLSVGYAPYKDSMGAKAMSLSNHVVSSKPWGIAAVSAERARLDLKRRVKHSHRMMGWLSALRRSFRAA